MVPPGIISLIVGGLDIYKKFVQNKSLHYYFAIFHLHLYIKGASGPNKS